MSFLKKRMAIVMAATAVGATVLAYPSFAEQPIAEFVVQPESEADSNEVWYEVKYTNGTNLVTGAAFYLKVADGVSIKTVEAGKQAEKSEVSSNIAQNNLSIMYLDNDAGETVPQKGDQIFRICVQGDLKQDMIPFVSQGADVCAVLENNNIINLETKMEVKSINKKTSQIETPALPNSSSDDVAEESHGHQSSQSTQSTQNGSNSKNEIVAASKTKSESTANEKTAESAHNSSEEQKNAAQPEVSSAASDSQSEASASPSQTDPALPNESSNKQSNHLWTIVTAILAAAAAAAGGWFLWKRKKQQS